MAMLGFFKTNEFWAALIGAAATISAVWFAVVLGLNKLRDTEMSRLRIKCVTELIAYRSILDSKAPASIEGRTTFMAALNAIPGLFGHDAAIMNLLRDVREEQPDRKTAALLQLIRNVAKITGVPLTFVSDIDLEHPFTY